MLSHKCSWQATYQTEFVCLRMPFQKFHYIAVLRPFRHKLKGFDCGTVEWNDIWMSDTLPHYRLMIEQPLSCTLGTGCLKVNEVIPVLYLVFLVFPRVAFDIIPGLFHPELFTFESPLVNICNSGSNRSAAHSRRSGQEHMRPRQDLTSTANPLELKPTLIISGASGVEQVEALQLRSAKRKQK